MIFYNEHDPYAAEWLRNLMFEGHIAFGVVSEEDIRDLRPVDLQPYTQVHLFAGIGVWSHALCRAGWPDDRPVWTGSCPCQPFSAAGQRGGEADERHLWPHFHWLIDQCRPPVVLGEQVASKDGLAWLDLVSTDLEASGYAFGASDLCAAGFGGAHLRQRLYFVGLAEPSLEQRNGSRDAGQGRRPQHPVGGATGGLADAGREGRQQVSANLRGRGEGSGAQGLDQRSGDGGDERRPHAPMLGRHVADWLFCRDGKWRPVEPGTFPLADAAPQRVGRLRAYGNALDAETASEFVAGVMDVLPHFETYDL